MTTTKTAQQAIADLSETLEYSIECGYVQHAAVRWLRDRHVAARDAHAAERAALTEQVARLTAERDEARALHEQALNERDEAHKALELAQDEREQ